jgi:hypothetical protein
LEINSNCMQFHSIFSFGWNLIFTKSNWFFHQLINWSSLVVHNNIKCPSLVFDMKMNSKICDVQRLFFFFFFCNV